MESGYVLKTGLASAAALLAALLLVALVLLVAHANTDRDRALAHERHSYEVLALTRGLDAAMARSEAALGRFVITGDKKTGTLYYDSWNRAGRLLHRLAAMTLDDSAQADLVRDLKDAYDARGTELAEPAARANYRQGWAAVSLFNEAGNSNTIDHIATILNKIEANEQSTLDQRSDRALIGADRSNLFARWLSVIGMAMAAFAILLAWLAIRFFTQRRAALVAAELEADRAEVLERAIADRTRELRQTNELLKQEAATRAEAEAQLRQVQKMEAMGQLTGGIAHDFNNMLAVVIGGLDLARRRLDQEPDEIARHIDNAMEGATRAAALTRRLLSFARSEPLRASGIDPAMLIHDMTDLLDRTLGERVQLIVENEEVPWLIWADEHQLESAIVNLVVNARDAMKGDGTLTIRSIHRILAADEIGTLGAGEYVCIEATDTGCGMTPDILARVFEPFFTTKPVGKGTGLGLSQIFGFARQSGGDVTITSTPGKGTTVSLYLQRYEGRTEGQTLTPVQLVPPAAPSSQGVTVLVVEDDPRVRIATVAALEELGHTSLACGSGEEALATLAERDDIELVITDVIMPVMTGPELVRHMQSLYPGIAVLFVTGYAGEAGAAEAFADHDVLRKPFTIKGLAAAIDKALDRVSGPHPAQVNAAAE